MRRGVVRPSVRVRGGGLAVALALGCAVPAAAQPVQGDVRGVGFTGRGMTRFVVREGAWTPVLLELTVPGDQHFEGQAQIEGRDLDDDRAVFVRRPLTLTAGAGLQRIWCYAQTTGAGFGAGRMRVEIVSADGAQVASLKVPAFELVSSDTKVIVDLSSPFLPAVAALDTGSETYTSLPWGSHRFYRSVCVASLRPRDLPDVWFGLEGAETIVWDDPDPAELSDNQLEALVAWVRRGGRLVLGLGPAAARLRGTPIEDLLPFEPGGRLVELERLPRLFATYAISKAARFGSPVVAYVGGLVPEATVIFEDRAPGAGVFPLLAMRMAGSGRVIASAVRLRDLTSVGHRWELLTLLFDLNRTPDGLLKNEAQAMAMRLGRVADLYAAAVEPIEFRATASVQMLAAFSFVLVYVAVATFASWAYLRRRRQTQLAWVVFAGIAVAGSVVSLGAVRLARGMRESVHTMSFVDLEAGRHAARARVLIGLRSPSRRRVRLALGDGPACYVRPLSRGRQPSGAYATPARYHVLAMQGRVDDALVRATLKQFEGFWQGRLEGTIDARIRIDRSSGRVLPDSWVRNNLPVPLRGGVLLYVDPRVRALGDVPARVAGLDHAWQPKVWGQKTVPAAFNVLAVELPALGPGQMVSDFASELYDGFEQALQRWNQRGGTADDQPMLPTLWSQQTQRWVPAVGDVLRLPVGGLNRADAAALLASTRGLYLHTSGRRDFSQVGLPVTTVGLPAVDVTHWLSRDTAVLLVYSDAPLPVAVEVDGRPVEPSAGRALYRVRVPVEYGTGTRGRP